MKGRLMITTAAGLGCILVSTTIWAVTPEKRNFERTDRNANGVVSREEYRDRMIEVFYSTDSDRDGYLDIDELGDPDPDFFKEADVSGDGRIELREFLNRRARDFTRADSNRDGALSEEEASEF